MKYYHGSRSKFTEFTQKGVGKHGEGYYFTADKNEAYYFAKSLYGNGQDKSPTVYTVSLKILKPFNTMSEQDCEEVMKYLNSTYKVPKVVGGAKEHYHHLMSQVKKIGFNGELNELLAKIGFDAVWWEFMDHMIVLNADQITILETEASEL